MGFLSTSSTFCFFEAEPPESSLAPRFIVTNFLLATREEGGRLSEGGSKPKVGAGGEGGVWCPDEEKCANFGSRLGISRRKRYKPTT